MKNLRRTWLSAAAVLCLSVAITCHKAEPDPVIVVEPPCDDGSCCNPPYPHAFIKAIENEPGDYSLHGFYVKNPPGVSNRIEVCPLSWDKLDNLKTTYFKDSVQLYQYRIWGKLYENRGVFTYAGPLYSLKIDHIDKVK